jgi:hypothetical protein
MRFCQRYKALICRRVWQYAINAVLLDLRGARQGALAWRSSAERASLRRQYAAAYRAALEKRQEGAKALVRSAA